MVPDVTQGLRIGRRENNILMLSTFCWKVWCAPHGNLFGIRTENGEAGAVEEAKL